jgi:uncharacterized coiled-coil protein SlyX
MSSPTIELLETKIAYLERAAAELSDEVYRQSQTLDALRAQLNSLLVRMDASAVVDSADTTTQLLNEKPPHY